MGGGTIMQQWGIGVSILPPVCTGTQNPQNYFSNTYLLPSVNRTAGPNILHAPVYNNAVTTEAFINLTVLYDIKITQGKII